MKIDRQIGIITILLQREKVTAPQLAEKFEVSRRTILRDIDDICSAGIPVTTRQGGDGGISIAEGYKLDKSVLTVEELASIVTGLNGLSSVMDSPRVERLIDRLLPKKEGVVSMRDSILIDLSSHYKSSLSEKIKLLKTAIAECKVVYFDYYSVKGMEHRMIEPCFITFKWSSWYIFGYCLDKNGFRLFKLNRLWRLRMLEESFTPREIPPDEPDADNYFIDENKVTILFEKSVEYLLLDEYGPGSYTETEDGKLLLCVGYTNRDYIMGWILSFGERARILEPKELVCEIRTITEKMTRNYQNSTKL